MTDLLSGTEGRAIALVTAPGIYTDITPEKYFAGICPERSLSSSAIKTLLTRTPADYRYGVRKVSPAMRMGDVAHQLALGKGKGFAVGPFADWRTKDAKAFKEAAEEEGLTPIKEADFQIADALAKVIVWRIKVTLSDIGERYGMTEPDGGWEYQTEVVMAWQEETPIGPIWCTGMMDVFCPALLAILDPKISPRLYDGVIENQIASMGYDYQAAFYRRAIEKIIPGAAGRTTFVNLFVHPDAPHVSRAVAVDEAWRHSAETEINRAIGIFARCVKTDTWPGFSPAVQTLNARSWTIAERMARELDGDDDDVA